MMGARGATLVLAWLMVAANPLLPARALAFATSFSADHVQKLAAEMASQPFAPPAEELPEQWAKLNYDQYRDIRFRRERAVWHGERRQFELQLLPSGWLFKHAVAIHLVDNGQARTLAPDNALFDFGTLAGPPPPGNAMSFSGFRVNGPINRSDVFDEIVVFQGASYFRAVSRGQVYGLSARGLAIDTGQSSGEEFPFFRAFWIETPPPGARQLVIHGLLDSPSATGAYTFRVTAGAPTSIDVDVRLYPRRDLKHVGIAPLTSMFLFSSIDRTRINDFRRAVHDSEGLAIAEADGERVWRPLANPKRLQISAFSVRDLKGFGLIQRSRRLSDYDDLEANYERRPSAWVEPKGSWGNGSVHLIEIPSDEEIHDNVVAYWRPREAYRPKEAYAFGYRLLWPNDLPATGQLAIVQKTSSGLANGPERKNGAVRYAVDFVGSQLTRMRELPKAIVSASAGKVSPPVVQRNPITGGVRVDFLLKPEQAELVELRLELKRSDAVVSEVWLTRWTK
jgi:periplasmic glucans biosynthesis protein